MSHVLCLNCLDHHGDAPCGVALRERLENGTPESQDPDIVPTRAEILETASVLQQLVVEESSLLERLEQALENSRTSVRELIVARRRSRRSLKALGEALEVVAAAVPAMPRSKRRDGRRAPSGAN